MGFPHFIVLSSTFYFGVWVGKTVLPWVQGLAIDHVIDAAGGADDDMLSRLEHANILLDVGAANTSVAENAHVVAQGKDDLNYRKFSLRLDGRTDR